MADMAKESSGMPFRPSLVHTILGWFLGGLEFFEFHARPSVDLGSINQQQSLFSSFLEGSIEQKHNLESCFQEAPKR